MRGNSDSFMKLVILLAGMLAVLTLANYISQVTG